MEEAYDRDLKAAFLAGAAHKAGQWRLAVLSVAKCIECGEAFGFYSLPRKPCAWCIELRRLIDAPTP